jgi:hypothetical protein
MERIQQGFAGRAQDVGFDVVSLCCRTGVDYSCEKWVERFRMVDCGLSIVDRQYLQSTIHNLPS